MAHAWKACWVQALGGSNPPSSATGPRDRFRFRGFCCLLLVAPLVFRASEGPAAVCAGGRRPAIGRSRAAEPRPRPPLDSEAFDDLCARECSQDLARHKELRSAQARADAAPSDRACRVDKEPP